MCEIRRVCLVVLVLLLAVHVRPGCTIRVKYQNPKSIYDALDAHGLPMGLLPKGVKEFSIDEENGSFEVHLDQACDAKYESELHYDRNISGRLSFGRIGNLTGMEAQDLFLWFPIKGIRVDIPSSGVIYFDVGVVFKQFSLSMFENPHDCVAASHPSQIQQLGAVNVLAEKLDGGSRYERFDKQRVGREVM